MTKNRHTRFLCMNAVKRFGFKWEEYNIPGQDEHRTKNTPLNDFNKSPPPIIDMVCISFHIIYVLFLQVCQFFNYSVILERNALIMRLKVTITS